MLNKNVLCAHAALKGAAGHLFCYYNMKTKNRMQKNKWINAVE